MGFLQIGFEVNRLAQNPDKPNEELIPPPLFRPANLLFGPKNTVNNNNKEIMTDNNGDVRAGPWSVQVGTAFFSDHVAMHQLLSGVYVGATIGVAGRVLRSPVATIPALVVFSAIMASAFATTILAKPKDDRRASPAPATGANPL
ncbi:hypothetical protein F5883DRAFT_635950 [Diaporthe sp. PMI_573]|nr:hypothetical protein F5883DRAFT_635950 [Diaporthaceae sp. PMI_573]